MSFERGWHAIEFKEYLSRRGKLRAIKTLVRRGTRTVLPMQLQCQALKLAHEGRPGTVAMTQRLRTIKCSGQALTKRRKEFVRPVMAAS